MSEELKPCRRCGLYVSPDGIEVTQTDTGTYTARFECPDCGEVAETCMRHSSEDFAVADVIDDWNRRWIDPALTAEIEGLKDTILKLTGRERILGDETILYAAPEMYDVLQHYFDLLEQANNGDAVAECKLFEDIVLIEQVLMKARGEA